VPRPRENLESHQVFRFSAEFSCLLVTSNAGFTCFRDVDELPFRFASKKLTSMACMGRFAGLAPRMIEPSLKEGMVPFRIVIDPMRGRLAQYYLIRVVCGGCEKD